MYLTIKQQVKNLSKDDYCSIKELCHTAKNLTNEAIYNVRQYYFVEGKFLKYEKNYSLLKNSSNYKVLNSNMAQQILKEVDGSFKSFFGLLKLAKQGKYDIKDCKLPHYLPKDGYTTLVIGFVRLKGNKLILPFSNSYKTDHKPVVITIPPILVDKKENLEVKGKLKNENLPTFSKITIFSFLYAFFPVFLILYRNFQKFFEYFLGFEYYNILSDY